jgi:hypothetical protein
LKGEKSVIDGAFGRRSFGDAGGDIFGQRRVTSHECLSLKNTLCLAASFSATLVQPRSHDLHRGSGLGYC